MDMTSLSSTLPGNNASSSASARKQQSHQSPEPNNITDDSQALMEAFQSAARSVTHLYRSSASLIRNSRQEGYTDALSDVLEAIDNESAYNDPALALSRIRDWVIDRRHEIRGGLSGSGSSRRGGSIPPRQQREMSAESEIDDGSKEEERREEQQRQNTGYSDVQQPQQQAQPFNFQPATPLPQYPIHTTDVIESSQPPDMTGMFTFNSPVLQQPPSRQATSKGPLTPRSGNVGNPGLGTGAGTKRRNQYIDFFELGGFGNFNFNGRDFGSGGGGGTGNGGGYIGQGNAKRGRFT
ncbi:hypothetical protein ABW19_dt0200955 [Dactylella cylindrospora]|nr:hypothetical protein ABW19_dt0200955 [Dactylella cylindrospora]